MSVDINKLASRLGLTNEDLKNRLAALGLVQVINEARRLAHQEVFDSGDEQKKSLFVRGHGSTRHKHVVAAARGLLS